MTKESRVTKAHKNLIFQDFLRVFLFLYLSGFHTICVEKERNKEIKKKKIVIFHRFNVERLYTFRAVCRYVFSRAV